MTMHTQSIKSYRPELLRYPKYLYRMRLALTMIDFAHITYNRLA